MTSCLLIKFQRVDNERNCQIRMSNVSDVNGRAFFILQEKRMLQKIQARKTLQEMSEEQQIVISMDISTVNVEF